MTAPPGPRLTIGEFSRMAHLSVKALRRYHERGLLAPAEVDAWTGYRYYRPEQIPTAQLIRRLRELDMPLARIRELVDTPEGPGRDELIHDHLRHLEGRLARTRQAMADVRRLLAAPVAICVVRTTTTDRPAAGITARVRRDDVLAWYADAMAELEAVMARRTPQADGPPGALFDNELFTDGIGRLTVYFPVPDPPTTGRVWPVTIPGGDLALTVHPGGHADIDVTYGELGRWVADHDLVIDGPVHERYPVGPRDTDRAERWRTELGWPVRPAAAGG